MPVCPSLVAYKTSPFCLLQHSPLSNPDHQRTPASFPLETMSGFIKAPTLHSKTSAVNHAGFPRLLWEMVSQALGCVVNPEYHVFQSEPVPRLCRYAAKVLIHFGPDKIAEPVVFVGKPMPTAALAIQTAAAEAVSRLRFKFPQIGEMREFRYFPNVSSFGCELADTSKEADPAIVRLVQFSTAQGLLLSGILGEFKALDGGITQAVGAAYRSGRQGSAQAVDPLLPSSVLSSQVVPPSQVVLPS